MGITQRMVAYYEAPNAQPPAHLLPQMAQALGAGADVLLGMTQPRKVKRLAANAVCSFRSVANRLAVRVAEPGVCVIFQFLQGADPSYEWRGRSFPSQAIAGGPDLDFSDSVN